MRTACRSWSKAVVVGRAEGLRGGARRRRGQIAPLRGFPRRARRAAARPLSDLASLVDRRRPSRERPARSRLPAPFDGLARTARRVKAHQPAPQPPCLSPLHHLIAPLSPRQPGLSPSSSRLTHVYHEASGFCFSTSARQGRETRAGQLVLCAAQEEARSRQVGAGDACAKGGLGAEALA